jgi:hypothetical protein
VTTATHSLYWTETGRVSCPAHMGVEGHSAYTAAPERQQYWTPLGVWDRVESDGLLLWAEEYGTRMACESCH